MTRALGARAVRWSRRTGALGAAAWLCAAFGCSSGDDSASDLPPAPTGPSVPPGGNYALEFDGVQEYATSGTAGFPIALGPHAISLWARYPSLEGTQIMIVLRADFESGVALGIADGTVAAWNVYGPRTLAAAAPPPAVDAWHHLAYVFDGTTHAVYVDGAVAGTGTREAGHRTPSLCWLGTVDGLSQFYRGRMDEVRIWKRARSAEELALEIAGGVASSDPDLAASWTFDQIEGARIADASGHGNLVSLGEGDPSRMPALVVSDAPEGR